MKIIDGHPVAEAEDFRTELRSVNERLAREKSEREPNARLINGLESSIRAIRYTMAQKGFAEE